MRTIRLTACLTLVGALAFLNGGCVKNVTKPEQAKTDKTAPKDKDSKPKIATRPETDEFDAAVKAANGDVEQALSAIGAHSDRNAAGKIEYVDLSGKNLSATGIAHLLKLGDSLQRISLNDAFVTADALQSLAGLPRLRKLELNRTPLTDDALGLLAKLKELRELSLRHTRIGDAGVAHLAALTELRHLSLSGTRITDQGLAHLEGFPKLTTLILDDTAVTGDGLQRLQSLPALQFLHLTGTKVSPAAVRAFRSRRPQVQIVGK